VKVTIMFRGRETQHPELGRRILDHVADRVVHVAKVEVMPKLDGRNMVMVLVPDKRAKAMWDAQKKADAEAAEQESAPVDATQPEATPVAEAPEATEANGTAVPEPQPHDAA
jgi:translation initiation factor IF-3